MEFLYRINKPLLLAIIFISFLAKLLGDSFFLILSRSEIGIAVIYRIIFSLIILASSALYTYRLFKEHLEKAERTSINSYFRETTALILLFSIFIVMSLLLPNTLIGGGSLTNVFSLLYVEIYCMFALLAGMYLILFLFKWLWLRRHRRTKSHLKTFRISLIILIILELPFMFIRVSIGDVDSNMMISLPFLLIELFVMLIMFISVRRNEWIASLSRRKKWRLILISLLIILLSIYIIALTLMDNGDGRIPNALLKLYGSGTIMLWPVMLAIPYFIRIMLSCLASLPTTGIVERRNYEINSLTYLNRLVAETIDFDNLIETVTQLALYSSGAVAAWTDVKDKDGKTTIRATQNIERSFLENLYAEMNFLNQFVELTEPVYIESIPDRKEPFFDGLKVLGFAKAMIAIPLFAGEEHLGNLVVLHNEEYGFEAGEINVLTAFSHNVNIALENARLVEDSLEKETYKRELMLAEDMQKKLLPESLPKIKNYTVDAFSIPASVVGGDYYDVLQLSDGRYAILIGDVSGKGITAAFYMAQLKGVAMAVAKTANGAADMLKLINNSLFLAMERKMYITMTVIVIENDFGLLSIARAGHLPIFIRTSDDTIALIPKGLGVGLAQSEFFDASLEEIQYQLMPGTGCLLCTDGVSEIKSFEENDFNYENLKHFLNSKVYNNADSVINDIRNKIEKETKNEARRDDITAISLFFNPDYIS